MKKILGMLLGMAMVLGGAMVPVLIPEKAVAEGTNICDDDEIDDELKQAAGCLTGDDREKTVMPIIVGVIQVALGVIGIVAVIVLVYGAIIYTTSTGDARKVYQAKNIILYAIVGLVISQLANAIVFFVSQAIWGK